MNDNKKQNEKIDQKQMKKIQAGTEKGETAGTDCCIAKPDCCNKTECCPTA